MNAFMLFSQYHRQSVRDANPGLKVTEVAKMLGGMWRALSEKEKDDYKNGGVGSEETCNAACVSDDDSED